MNKEEFLLDTLDYYTTDTSRRCEFNSACYYSPNTIGKEKFSDGCSIGRHLTKEAQKTLDRASALGRPLNISQIFRHHIYNKYIELIPEWMRELGVSFLSSVQRLHDDSSHWGENKLSEEGELALYNLLDSHDIDKSKFTKYIN